MEKGASYTLYIAETDENGKPVDKEEGFAYDVTVAPAVISKTPSNSDGSSGTPYSSSGTSVKTGVKTGDDTPIALYTFLPLIASAAIVEAIRRRNAGNSSSK